MTFGVFERCGVVKTKELTEEGKRIFVAGHTGMVGSALVRRLASQKSNVILIRGRDELDLESIEQVRQFFSEQHIDEVYLAAAKVGGIWANNTLPSQFMLSNLSIQNNVIKTAFENGVKKLLFLGSSCIYPKQCMQPIIEEALLTSSLEITNEAYALAKITGLKLCEYLSNQFIDRGIDYRSVMPCNLYGPGDRYSGQNAHVIPALIEKFHEAKASGVTTVELWGSGLPRREFLFVDDLADACVEIMNCPRHVFDGLSGVGGRHLNVGYGSDVTIEELANMIRDVVGYNSKIHFDRSMPDGTMRKLLDSSKIQRLGWTPKTSLEEGIAIAYNDYLKQTDANCVKR